MISWERGVAKRSEAVVETNPRYQHFIYYTIFAPVVLLNVPYNASAGNSVGLPGQINLVFGKEPYCHFSYSVRARLTPPPQPATSRLSPQVLEDSGEKTCTCKAPPPPPSPFYFYNSGEIACICHEFLFAKSRTSQFFKTYAQQATSAFVPLDASGASAPPGGGGVGLSQLVILLSWWM